MKQRPTSLRLERIAAGLRIADVARATGLTDSRVSQIERLDGRPPDPFELDLITGALTGAPDRRPS